MHDDACERAFPSAQRKRSPWSGISAPCAAVGSALGFALFLSFVARPLSVLAGLLGTRTSSPLRGMVGWFGVRGIGSLYYLMYAIEHGRGEGVLDGKTVMQLRNTRRRLRRLAVSCEVLPASSS